MVDRRLGQLHTPGQLPQVELRVGGAPPSHLAQRRRQPVELARRVEPFNSRRLPEPGADGLADVGGFEVEPAVHLPAHISNDSHVLELHHRPARAHERQQTNDAVALLDVDDVLPAPLHDAHPGARGVDHVADGGCPRFGGGHELQVIARARRIDRPAAEEETAEHRFAVACRVGNRARGRLGERGPKSGRERQLDEEGHALARLDRLVLGVHVANRPAEPHHLSRDNIAEQREVGGLAFSRPFDQAPA